MKFMATYHFYQRERNLEKPKSLLLTCKIQLNMLFMQKLLKQALNHDLILKKVYRVISFNQDKWLKPYIEMNNKLRTEAKNNFEKDFFKLMNNAVLVKQWRI